MKIILCSILIMLTCCSIVTGCRDEDKNVASQSASEYSSIDVLSEEIPSGPAIIDNQDKSDVLAFYKIQYVGEWKHISSEYAYKKTSSYIWDTGAFYQFKFKGTKFVLRADKQDFLGIATVFIDGEKVEDYDAYSATVEYDVPIYTSKTLPDGIHTVKVMNSGKRNPKCKARPDLGACLTIDNIETS